MNGKYTKLQAILLIVGATADLITLGSLFIVNKISFMEFLSSYWQFIVIAISTSLIIYVFIDDFLRKNKSKFESLGNEQQETFETLSNEQQETFETLSNKQQETFETLSNKQQETFETLSNKQQETFETLSKKQQDILEKIALSSKRSEEMIETKFKVMIDFMFMAAAANRYKSERLALPHNITFTHKQDAINEIETFEKKEREFVKAELIQRFPQKSNTEIETMIHLFYM